MKRQTRAEWQRQMRALHREAAGCVEMWVILFGDLPDLMACSRAGGATALLLLRSISQAVQHMEAQPKDEPALCGCCSRPVDICSVAFVVTLPYGLTSPERAMAMAICDKHGHEREDIRLAGLKALQDVWPDIRPISIDHWAGGRA